MSHCGRCPDAAFDQAVLVDIKEVDSLIDIVLICFSPVAAGQRPTAALDKYFMTQPEHLIEEIGVLFTFVATQRQNHDATLHRYSG